MRQKTLNKILGLLLVLAVLTGCSPPAVSTAMPAQSSSASPSSSEALQDAPPIYAFLPSGEAALAELLMAIAAQDGYNLHVQTAAAGSGYAQALNEALSGSTPPDIYWLEDEVAAKEVFSEALPVEMLSGQAGEMLQSLAAMVPASMRLGEAGAVYSLPVGYYAEGVLVNIELLAAIFGITGQTALLRDLMACSWEEWAMLVRSVEQYLAQPGRIQVTLGDGVYITEAIRPDEAQALRGVYAQPTGDITAFCGNSLQAMLSACSATQAEYIALDEQELAERLQPAVEALWGLLELETMHMTLENGPFRRGEGYEELPAVSTADVEELFVGGNALFMRTSSIQAAQIEAENPQLAGKLAILPIKLPQVELQQAEDSGKTVESGTESSGELASALSPQAIATQEVYQQVNEAIAQNNSRLLVASSGYLCIAEHAAENSGVASLLLRLYTSSDGQRGLAEQVGVVPFSEIYPATGLQQQVAAAAASGDASAMVTAPSSLELATQSVGGHVLQNYMESFEWTPEQQSSFTTTVYAAFGLLVPGIGTGLGL